MQRRHVHISLIKYIGKKSKGLEDVAAGLVHSEQEVYTAYTDTRRDEWETVIGPRLKELSLAELEKKSGLSCRTLMKARAGQTRPHRKNQTAPDDCTRVRRLDRGSLSRQDAGARHH